MFEAMMFIVCMCLYTMLEEFKGPDIDLTQDADQDEAIEEYEQ